MKNKTNEIKNKTEDLENQLLDAIYDFEHDKVKTIASELGDDLTPHFLMIAIEIFDPKSTEILATQLAKNHNYSLSAAFDANQNPIIYVINSYINLQNNASFKDLTNYLFSELLKMLNIFKQHDCVVTNDILLFSMKKPELMDTLLEFQNVDIENVNLITFAHNATLFKKLISKGATQKIEVCILQAIHTNNTSLLDAILETKNLNLDIQNDTHLGKATPLALSAYYSREDITEKLISAGANIQNALLNLNQTNISELNNENIFNILNFYIKHDKLTQEFIEKISDKNVYQLYKQSIDEKNILYQKYIIKYHIKDMSLKDINKIFTTAKENNDHKLISLMLEIGAKDIFKNIETNLSTKENIKYFIKNSIPFKFKYELQELCAKKIKDTNEKWDVEFEFNTSDLIIGSLIGYGYEGEKETNTHDIERKSAVTITKGMIYDAKQKLVNHIKEDSLHHIYILSKSGKLHLQNDDLVGMHHSFFIKSTPGKELYGYGKPVACGGHINISNGKIVYIDNNSGHYQPTINQLKLALKFLDKQGVLTENTIVKNSDHKQLDLKEILKNPVIDETPYLFGDDNSLNDNSEFIN